MSYDFRYNTKRLFIGNEWIEKERNFCCVWVPNERDKR